MKFAPRRLFIVTVSLIGWVLKSTQLKFGQAYNLALVWLEYKKYPPDQILF